MIPNESEAEALTGMNVQSVADARKASDALRKMGAKSVIITLGENGAMLNGDGECRHVAAFKPPVVEETTGAGRLLLRRIRPCAAARIIAVRSHEVCMRSCEHFRYPERHRSLDAERGRSRKTSRPKAELAGLRMRRPTSAAALNLKVSKVF